MNSSGMSLVRSQLEQILRLKYGCLDSDYLILNIYVKKLMVKIDIKLNPQFNDNPYHPYMRLVSL